MGRVFFDKLPRMRPRRNPTAIIALTATALLLTTGCGDIRDQDEYQDRLDAIDAVYQQGVETRQRLNKSGTTLPDEATCSDAFHRIGADTERDGVRVARKNADGKPDLAFGELRRLSFINGCLGRPNDLPATPLPPAGSPQPSTTGTPTGTPTNPVTE